MSKQRISTQREAPFGYLTESGLVALLGDLSGDARIQAGLGGLAVGACPQALSTHRFDHVLGGHAFFGRFGEYFDRRFHRAELGGGRFLGSLALHQRRVVGLCGVLGRVWGRGRLACLGARRGLCGARAGRRLGLRALCHFACSFHSPRRAGNTHHEGMTSQGLQGESAWNLRFFGVRQGDHHARYA